MPVFSTWLSMTLARLFKFDTPRLLLAHEELYSSQIVIVSNVKPVMGEFEQRAEKTPRLI